MTRTLYALISAASFFLLPASQTLADTGPRPSPTTPSFTTSVDDPGRIPYQFFTSSPACGQPAGPPGFCVAHLPGIPLGKRLVIQRWALVAIQNGGTNTVAIAELQVTRNVQSTVSVGTITSVSAFANQLFTFDQPTLGVADPGNNVTVLLESNSSADFQFVSFTVTGYLLDCTVNLCAPVAP